MTARRMRDVWRAVALAILMSLVIACVCAVYAVIADPGLLQH